MKSKILQKSIISLEIVLCLFLNMVALTSCNRKETQNEWNSELISNISEENMIETIENISRKPRCIGSKENDIVYDYMNRKLINMGYATEKQRFYFTEEKNNESIKKRSDLQAYLNGAFTDDVSGINGVNLIAEKNHDQSKRTLILSAHYDTCKDSTGANDNGSGIAVLLETARILSDKQLPFNVMFVFFSGEESWFVGSRYFVSQKSEKEKNDMIGVINVDTVAQKSNLGYWIMVGEGKESEDKEGNFTVEPEGNFISDLFTNNQRFSLTCQMNSDHYPFSMVGIPAISIVQDMTEGIAANSQEDTMDIIDPKRLSEVTRIILKILSDIKI